MVLLTVLLSERLTMPTSIRTQYVVIFGTVVALIVITTIILVMSLNFNTSKEMPREYIGVAYMDKDRALHVVFGGEKDGEHMDARMKYEPGAPGYEEMVLRVGGLEPGESKPIPLFAPSHSSIQKICAGVTYASYGVEYTNQAGDVGGYFVSATENSGILDAPAFIFDTDGVQVAIDSIFNTPEERDSFRAKFALLREQYPNEQQFTCGTDREAITAQSSTLWPLTYRAYSAEPYPQDEQQALLLVVQHLEQQNVVPEDYFAQLFRNQDGSISVTIYHGDLVMQATDGSYQFKPEFEGSLGEPDAGKRSREYIIDPRSNTITNEYRLR